MNIGIDFDNTIVTYDKVFHRYAVNLGHISKDVPMCKREIRDAIRSLPDGESKWIRLQGLVYGHFIEEAEFSPGVERFFNTCRNNSIRMYIISHKTKYPALGPQYDLRAAARKWLGKSGLVPGFGLSMDDCYFVDSLADKLLKIAECRCDYFIDDLVEVLDNEDFPTGVRGILYSPGADPDHSLDITGCHSWDSIHEFIFGGR